MMKGWQVCVPHAGCIHARAETRSKARKFWPDDPWEFSKDYPVSITRAAWLDGGDKEGEVFVETTPCDESEYLDSICFEGYDGMEKIDKDATLDRLSRQTAMSRAADRSQDA